MNIEEKARAYDKAIEKIKYVMEHGVSPVLNKEDLQDLFQELKESEDERVRKELIELLNDLWEGKQGLMTDRKDYERYTAWLEKQGEQKPQRMVSAEAKEALYDKPKWTEEDDYNVRCCIARVESDIVNGCPERNKELIDWLESLKERMEGK